MCSNYRKSHCCVLLVNLHVVNEFVAACGAACGALDSAEALHIQSWVWNDRSALHSCMGPQFCF